jgi:hypothetical protein
MPGYTAEYQLYDVGGVRWMLIQDSVDGEYMGKYIYMWPQQDSRDVWQDQDQLPGRVGRVLESVNYYLKKYSK